MAVLVMRVEINADTTLKDPEEVADDIVETYNDSARWNAKQLATTLEARWG